MLHNLRTHTIPAVAAYDRCIPRGSRLKPPHQINTNTVWLPTRSLQRPDKILAYYRGWRAEVLSCHYMLIYDNLPKVYACIHISDLYFYFLKPLYLAAPSVCSLTSHRQVHCTHLYSLNRSTIVFPAVICRSKCSVFIEWCCPVTVKPLEFHHTPSPRAGRSLHYDRYLNASKFSQVMWLCLTLLPDFIRKYFVPCPFYSWIWCGWMFCSYSTWNISK